MSHEHYMARALELARRGAGRVAPNPMVGSVVVHDNRIIGEGWHETFGGPHAEVNAIRSVSDPEQLRSATLYVTLEPCCHHGKTPPCTDLILSSGIRRVVVGAVDPFPRVDGRGIERLRAAGVEVIEGVSAAACVGLNCRFLTAHRFRRPWVVLKWARTADNYIARTDGSSRWISSEESRRLAHEWRSEEAAVMVGTNTARIDDPELTVRHVTGPQPVRVVLDRHGTLPPELKVFDGSARTLLLTGGEPHRSLRNTLEIRLSSDGVQEILAILHQQQLLSVMVEGGAQLLSSFIKADLWDEARVVTAPERFGAGLAAPDLPIPAAHSTRSGPDMIHWYRNHWGAELVALNERNQRST